MKEYSELHYPNLMGCRVKMTGSAAANGETPTVSLPKEVIDAAKIAIPATPYDFALGRSVVFSNSDRKTELIQTRCFDEWRRRMPIIPRLTQAVA